ncbi:MAG: hypothetical protein HYY18_05330 [Planctomycetes bacterium]|nr:hypothetical protein [Planctomycetota bacterium]
MDYLLRNKIVFPEILPALKAWIDSILADGHPPRIPEKIILLAAIQGAEGDSLIAETILQCDSWGAFPYDCLASAYTGLDLAHPVMAAVARGLDDRFVSQDDPCRIGSAYWKIGTEAMRSRYRTTVMTSTDTNADWFAWPLIAYDPECLPRLDGMTDAESARLVRVMLLPLTGTCAPDANTSLAANAEGVRRWVARVLESPDEDLRNSLLYVCDKTVMREILAADPALLERIDRAARERDEKHGMPPRRPEGDKAVEK